MPKSFKNLVERLLCACACANLKLLLLGGMWNGFRLWFIVYGLWFMVYRLWKTVVRLWAKHPACVLADKARLVPTKPLILNT